MTRPILLPLAFALSLVSCALGAAPTAAQTASVDPDVLRGLMDTQAERLAAMEAEALEVAGGRNATFYRLMDAYLATMRQRFSDNVLALRSGGATRTAIAPTSTDRRLILEKARDSHKARKTTAGSLRPLDQDDRRRIDFEMEQVQTKVFWGWQTPPGGLTETIAITRSGRTRCSGALIGARTILTAAHCFCQSGGFDYRGNVRFGDSVKNVIETIPIKWAVLKDPDFCRHLAAGQSIGGEDLAIAVMTRKPRVAPIRPGLVVDFARQYLHGAPRGLVIVGYGRTETGGIGLKKYATVPVLSQLCQGWDAGKYGCTNGKEVVLGGLHRPDTCHGDSGGPVFLLGNRPLLRPRYVVAITSRGTGARDCGSGGIYTLLGPDALDWLCRWQKAIGFEVAGRRDVCR